MFIEHRTYSIRPGEVPAYIKNYLDGGGISLQEKMAPCVGWYVVEAGDLHRLVTMWKFEDMQQRQMARERLNEDPRWKALMENVKPLVMDIRSQLLVPAPFWAETAQGKAALQCTLPKSGDETANS